MVEGKYKSATDKYMPKDECIKIKTENSKALCASQYFLYFLTKIVENTDFNGLPSNFKNIGKNRGISDEERIRRAMVALFGTKYAPEKSGGRYQRKHKRELKFITGYITDSLEFWLDRVLEDFLPTVKEHKEKIDAQNAIISALTLATAKSEQDDEEKNELEVFLNCIEQMDERLLPKANPLRSYVSQIKSNPTNKKVVDAVRALPDKDPYITDKALHAKYLKLYNESEVAEEEKNKFDEINSNHDFYGKILKTLDNRYKKIDALIEELWPIKYSKPN